MKPLSTLLLVFLYFALSETSGQNIGNYALVPTSGSYTAISNGTSIDDILYDNNFSPSIDIGFDFFYMGQRYRELYVNSNGFVSFNANSIYASESEQFINDLTNSSLSGNIRPVIAPLWDDLKANPDNGAASYVLTGTAPNRVFTVEWLNFNWQATAGTASMSFQLKLYETSGKIEFVYKRESVGPTDPSASIGITYDLMGSGNFLSVLDGSISPATSTSVEETNIGDMGVSDRPVTGQIYAFESPAPDASPIGFSVTDISPISMRLNWSDMASNEVGYAIYSSTDGVNYSFFAITYPDAIDFNAEDLAASTTYHWKVYAITEGMLSSALTGTGTTDPAGLKTPVNNPALWSEGADWSGGIAPTAGDSVVVSGGEHVIIDEFSSACYQLMIGGGVGTATVEFEELDYVYLSMGKDVTILSNGILRSNLAGSQKGHSLLMRSGNITNNGTLDLSTNGNTAGAFISFESLLGPQTFTCGAASSTNLISDIGITLYKGAGTLLTFTPAGTFTVEGVTSKSFLDLFSGGLELAGTSTFVMPVLNESSNLLPAGGVFKLNNPNFTVVGNGVDFTLEGKITVAQGTMSFGNAADIGLIANGNAAYLEVTGGQLNIAGRLSMLTGTLRQTAGNIQLPVEGNGTGFPTLEVTGTYLMSGGTITILDANTGGVADVSTTTGTYTLSGGSIVLGGSSTPASTQFLIEGNIPKLSFHSGSTHRVVLSNNTLIRNELAFNSASNTFDLNSKTLTLQGTVSGGGSIIGSATSSITVNGSGTVGTLSFASGSRNLQNLTLNRSGSGTLTLGSDLTIMGTLSFGTNGSKLAIGSNTLSVSTITGQSLSRVFTGNGSSILSLSGTGVATLFFDQTTPGTTNSLGGLIINRGGAIVSLGAGSNLEVQNAFTLTSGKLAIGANSLTLGGSISTSATNSIRGNGLATSSLIINNTGNATFFVDQTTSGTTNRIGNVTINRIGNTVTMGNQLQVLTALTITAGQLAIGANTLNVRGTLTTNASGTLSGNGVTSIITFDGNSDVTLFMNQITPGTTNRLSSINWNRNGAILTMGNDLQLLTSLILTSGKLTLGSNTLTLNGTLTNTATNCLVANGLSSVSIGGSGSLGSNLFLDQTTPGTSNRLLNLTINRASQTITLGNATQLAGTLTPTAGTLAAGNNLTLVSDASNTARIADGGCTSCSYITGNIIVQRHIPAVSRRWRFMGSPLTTATLSDWKSEMYITGIGGATNGFDATASNQASVYGYNESLITGDLNTGWEQATNITNTLVVGKGYRVFIRGDRSDAGRLTGSNTTQNAVTLDLTGAVNQGDITMPVTFTSSGTLANDGWCLLANPYPSAYDWNAHYDNGTFHSNLSPTVWVLSAQTGGYISYNASSNAGSLTGGIIPPGASFWVKATAAAPSLTFKEQFKVGTTPVGVFKTDEGETFSIKLEKDSITSDLLFVKYMDTATANFDEQYDIRKMAGTVNLNSYGSDNVQLSLTVRPTVLDVDTIKLSVAGSTGDYKLKFANSEELGLQDNALLIDTYLSTVTDLKVSSEYAFTITSNAATQGLNRFYIVTGSNSALPVKLLVFGARKTEQHTVSLNWSTAQETNNSYFELQRSTDGTHYETIGTVKGNGTTSSVINYGYMDANPKRINYYRLKQVDYSGVSSYSEVRMVRMDEMNASLVLYPNPVKDLVTFTAPNGQQFVSYVVYDLNGKEVLAGEVPEQSTTLNVGRLTTGVYLLTLKDESGSYVSEKLIKE